MRIALATDDWLPHVSGVVRTIEDLVREAPNLGHEIHLITHEDAVLKVPVPGEKGLKFAYRNLRDLRTQLLEIRPDAVTIAAEGPIGFQMMRLCKKEGIPFSTMYCTHWDLWTRDHVPRPLRNTLPHIVQSRVTAFHNRASSAFVATPQVGKEMADRGITTDTHVMGRGANIDLFKPEGSRTFQGVPRPISLYVGRVSDEKNLPAFLDMDIEGTKVIVGEGSALEKLKRKYEAAAKGRVIFAGPLAGERLAEAFRSADMFVFPSRFDTYGRVLIEAMASGLPIVSYPLAAAPMLVTDDRFGALDLSLQAAWEKVSSQLNNFGPNIAQIRHDYIRDNHTPLAVARKFFAGQVQIETAPWRDRALA